MNARLEVVVVVLTVGLIFITVLAVRRYRFRRARNWQKLGDTLRRAKMKQTPYVPSSGSGPPRHDSGGGVAADPPGSRRRGSATDGPDDRGL